MIRFGELLDTTSDCAECRIQCCSSRAIFMANRIVRIGEVFLFDSPPCDFPTRKRGVTWNLRKEKKNTFRCVVQVGEIRWTVKDAELNSLEFTALACCDWVMIMFTNRQKDCPFAFFLLRSNWVTKLDHSRAVCVHMKQTLMTMTTWNRLIIQWGVTASCLPSWLNSRAKRVSRALRYLYGKNKGPTQTFPVPRARAASYLYLSKSMIKSEILEIRFPFISCLFFCAVVVCCAIWKSPQYRWRNCRFRKERCVEQNFANRKKVGGRGERRRTLCLGVSRFRYGKVQAEVVYHHSEVEPERGINLAQIRMFGLGPAPE